MYLVTGGTGFIGSCLVRRLQQQGLKTRVMVRPYLASDEHKDPSVEYITADLLKPETLVDLTKDIDIVIHIAGATHALNRSVYYKVNVEGTRNLVLACKKSKVKKIIFISTTAISKSGGPYSRSKIEAEDIIKKSSMDFTILRLGEVYGGNKDRGIGQLIGMIQSHSVIPIIGNGSYCFQPVYVEDVVSAIVSACNTAKANFKVYNIGGPDIFMYNDLVKLICESMNLKRRLIHVPALAAVVFAYFSSFVLKKTFIYPDQIPRLISPKEESIKEAAEDLNYSPIGFKEGLRLILNIK